MAGYIGSKASVVSSGVENKKVITATAGQTAFTGLTYSPNRVHVFQNGVRLVDGTDYTATDGNSLTLTVGASADDQVVVVSYSGFQTSDTVSSSAGGTFTGDVNFTGAFTSQGIDDNATSTAMTLDASGNLLVGTTSTATNDVGFKVFQSTGQTVTTASNTNPVLFNRKTSDGDIAIFRKDDSTVGSIGTTGGSSYIEGVSGTCGIGFAQSGGQPWLNPIQGGSDADATVNLGRSAQRFKDLYLSGGVYLGGTGSANKLDRYEEGTWNLTCTAFTTTSSNASYRVIGDVCYAWFYVDGVSNLNSNAVRINLPFTSAYGAGFGSAGSVFANFNNLSPTSCWVGNQASVVDFYNSVSTNSQYTQFAGGNIYGANAANFAMYGQFRYRIA